MMKTIQTLQDLWQHYFIDTPQIDDVDAWSIVFIARDTRGVLISLANPYTEEHDEAFVENVSSHDLKLFENHYKNRFMEALNGRYTFTRPEVDRVLTEYPDWQTFYEAWLNDDAQLLQGNMPLLFDYPSSNEYRAMQLKNADHAGYRRMLIVIYQYRKRQFQRIFIKNVDDRDYAHIQKQVTQLYSDSMTELITKKVTAST